jgi:16S rRNA (guanine527-N7)-methyltransferase
MTSIPEGLDVSRETFEDLTQYHDLLVKWNAKINLVSKTSIDALWDRHIWDSAQIVPLSGDALNWVDLGSGGGFPALVVAIMAKRTLTERRVTMVESDQRKAAFLRTVIRQLSLNAEVLVSRVELADPLRADVLSARALADLDQLLIFAQRHLAKDGRCVFLKGETWQNEVEIARKTWSFDLRAHRSKTSPSAAILEIKDIQRV